MRLYLFAFGRLKTAGLRETADYYKKILRPWVALEELELKPAAVPDKSPNVRSKLQEKEGESLLSQLTTKIGARGGYYLLEEGGKTLDTQGWAELAREWESRSVTEIGLCVGSSLGFSDATRRKSRGTLSLGPQTLSHELARVVLLEQLYRAWSVIRGHPYHNEGS